MRDTQRRKGRTEADSAGECSGDYARTAHGGGTRRDSRHFAMFCSMCSCMQDSSLHYVTDLLGLVVLQLCSAGYIGISLLGTLMLCSLYMAGCCICTGFVSGVQDM